MSDLVLAIESSCDETAAAVVDATGWVVADVVSSQVDIHHEFGGVVPELASRHHILNIVPVLEATLRSADVDLSEIRAVSVTAGPGLVGALLVGLQFAKALSFARGIPLVGVDHLMAHIEAPYLRDSLTPDRQGPPIPHLFLLVSGGHTVIGVRRSGLSIKVLGQTRDDAAGEAFDKVAKMLGLGYPGGQVIDRLAATGRRDAVAFPRAMRHRSGFDVSFSGLKTAVRSHLAKTGLPAGPGELADLCASFQEAVVDVLLSRVIQAYRETGLDHVVVAGGVAANGRLREALTRASSEHDLSLYLPSLRYCTDNAAMVALAGHRRLSAGQVDGIDLNAWSSSRGSLS